MITLDDALGKLLNHAQDVMIQGEMYGLTVVGFREDGGQVLMMPMLGGLEGSTVRSVYDVVGLALSYFDCRIYVTGAESWVRKYDKHEIDEALKTYKHGEMEKDPKREEILILYGSERDSDNCQFKVYKWDTVNHAKILKPDKIMKDWDPKNMQGGLPTLWEMYRHGQEQNIPKADQRIALKSCLIAAGELLTLAMFDFRDHEFEKGMGTKPIVKRDSPIH